MDSKQLETKVAETMLQRPLELTLGGKKYKVAPPSIGTLLLVSEKISAVPDIGDLNGADAQLRARTILSRAKDYSVLPEILAILILGSKHINEEEAVEISPVIYANKGIFRKKRVIKGKQKIVKRYDRLVQLIRDEVSPEQMASFIPFMLGSLQLTDFFVLTSFLREINLAKPGEEVKITARGQSSPASRKRTM